MWLTKLKFYIMIFLLLLFGLLFVLEIVGWICPLSLVANSVEQPVVTVRNSDFLCTGISQIVSDDNNIYVLFGQYGVVQVYTQGGDYQYTISVYNHLNGRNSIAAQDNCLYICDKISNVYLFQDGVLTEFIDRTEAAQKLPSLSFGAWDAAYSVRCGSIWRETEGHAAERVIQRPAFLAIYQTSLLSMGPFYCLILLGFVSAFPLPGKNKKESGEST